MKENRNYALDVLKTIGLIGIVIAHCHNIPACINYLRNFEVILMVLISGELMCSTRGGAHRLGGAYLWKRVKRIVIPTWTFLTMLFSGILIISKITGSEFPYSIRQVIESYTMVNGIGYVWIMLVFCFVAVGTPMIMYLLEKHSMRTVLMIIAIGIYVMAYESLTYFIVAKMNPNSEITFFLKETILYFLAYSLIAAIPFILKEMKCSTKIFIGVVCLALHYVMYFGLYSGSTISSVMSTHKFPPRMIYSLYGIGVSLILIELVKKYYRRNNLIERCCVFISKNSQWFYFNHILMIFVWNMILMNSFPQWWLMFMFVMMGSALLTICMRKIADAVCMNSGMHLTKIVKAIFG